MATKTKALGGEQLDVLLEELKLLGVTSLGELFARTRLEAKLGPAAIREVGSRASVFFGQKKPKRAACAMALVATRDREAEALKSDELLLSLLRIRVALGNRTRAHSKSGLTELLPSRLRKPMGATLERRFSTGDWPEGVGCVRGRGGPLVFLLDDVQTATSSALSLESSVHSSPLAPSPDAVFPSKAVPFDQLFEAAFDRLREERGINLVKLSRLRQLLPQFDPDRFEQELRKLRARNDYVLQSFDGRHGDLSEADRSAAITETGRTFVYVARREHA